MPTQVTQNTSLSLTLDGTEVNCQLKNLDFTPPGYGAPTVMLTACPDGQVKEPGSYSPGTIAGEVVGDTTDQGLTWLLNTAAQSGAEVAYVLTFFDDQDNTVAVTFTGTATVEPFAWSFARPGTFSHSISLTVLTADVSRPA